MVEDKDGNENENRGDVKVIKVRDERVKMARQNDTR